MPEERTSNGPDFEEWKLKFKELQRDANEYGLASVVLLTSSDPLNQKEVFSHEIFGGRIKAVGMLQQTLMNLQNADMKDQ